MDRNRLMKRVAVVVVLLLIIGGSTLALSRRGKGDVPTLRVAEVKRGDLVATISATGTVEPEEVIDVGAQVAGRIVAFGKDRNGKVVDYGSEIEAGTILAQIDDSLYASDVAQAKAQVDQAVTGVARSEADLGQMQAKLTQAERDWNRAKKLGPSDALAQSAYDAAQSAYEVAKANLAVGKAAVVQAKSAVAQAKATLARAQQNLDYCTITSPVKGVIIDRRVNIGQTVVASLNAPSLFLIAKDLKQMEVWVAVNEADIGNIQVGQPVTFTVDAFPGEAFQGKVGKIRMNATMTQNVVTYTVEVHTDNSSGKLLPYLTANVKFTVGDHRNVLLVPNAALRWTPSDNLVAPGSRGRRGAGAAGSQGESSGDVDKTGLVRGVVWVPDGSLVRPVSVGVGLSDGTVTEIQSDKLKEGAQVALGEEAKEAKGSSSSASPFTPQLFRKKGQ